MNKQAIWRQRIRKAMKTFHTLAKVARDLVSVLSLLAWLIHLFH